MNEAARGLIEELKDVTQEECEELEDYEAFQLIAALQLAIATVIGGQVARRKDQQQRQRQHGLHS